MMSRKCDIEVSCGPCGEKQAKIKNVGTAWYTLEIEFKDDKKLILDGLDTKPAPYNPEPGILVYHKNKKKYELKDYKSISIKVTTLCTDPKCDDPMCRIWQELQRLKNKRPWWKKLFGRRKKS
jgi:hypothetical protein